MSILSAQELDFFKTNGVVCLRNFMHPSWITLLGQGFNQVLDDPSPNACFYTAKDAPGMFRDDYCNWHRIPQFREVIFQSHLAETAGFLLHAQEIRFFHEHIFFKKRGTVKKTPWHQDLPYYCVDGDQGISFWIPLDDIDASNTIEFIAGSHAWGKLFTPKKFNGIDTYNVPHDLYEELPDIDKAGFLKLSWSMKRGDVVAFDFRTIHGNSQNSDEALIDRQTVSLRFIGEKMRYSKRPGEKSPPFPSLADHLKPGDAMIHPLFPLIWKKTLSC